MNVLIYFSIQEFNSTLHEPQSKLENNNTELHLYLGSLNFRNQAQIYFTNKK